MSAPPSWTEEERAKLVEAVRERAAKLDRIMPEEKRSRKEASLFLWVQQQYFPTRTTKQVREMWVRLREKHRYEAICKKFSRADIDGRCSACDANASLKLKCCAWCTQKKRGCDNACPGRTHFPHGDLPPFLRHVKSLRVAIIFKHLGLMDSIDQLSAEARPVADELARSIGMIVLLRSFE